MPTAQDQLLAREAERALIDYHLSDEGIASVASPDSIDLATTSELDPAYFEAMTARYREPSGEARSGQGIQVEEARQPRTATERQIEALSSEQQKTVIAEVACYLVAMRAHHLRALAVQAAAKYRQR